MKKMILIKKDIKTEDMRLKAINNSRLEFDDISSLQKSKLLI